MTPTAVSDRPFAHRSSMLPSPALESTSKLANMALRFIVEMAAYAALGYWGASNPSPVTVRVALAALTPLAAIVLWSLLLAPKARCRLTDPLAIVSELAVFVGAAIALAVSGRVWLSQALIAVAVINTLLVRLFERQSSAATDSSQPPSTAMRGAE